MQKAATKDARFGAHFTQIVTFPALQTQKLEKARGQRVARFFPRCGELCPCLELASSFSMLDAQCVINAFFVELCDGVRDEFHIGFDERL
jgi:hypothetical protein